MRLVAITEDGGLANREENVPDIALKVLRDVSAMYLESGYVPPWTGYIAFEGSQCVGTCAFRTPPSRNEVEIAYFTFSGNEGRGVATRMAGELIRIAREAIPGITVLAYTLPFENASTAVLGKLGFRRTGETIDPEAGRVWEWRLEDAGAVLAVSRTHG